jgi:hypothetical protein
MGLKMSPEDTKLYKRCDEVLHYLWDPIGVAGEPRGRDEYDSYLPQVFMLLRESAGRDQVVNYLVQAEVESMGLSGNRVRAERVAEMLVKWRECIANEAS